MGWEVAKIAIDYTFRFAEMAYVTAEGLVTLASVVEAMRTIAEVNLDWKSDKVSSPAFLSSGIASLFTQQWTPLSETDIRETEYNTILPLTKLAITSEENARDAALRFS